ncbi:MAG: aminoglycoside phosphotransferase family protein [Nitrospira sp.]
MMSTGSLENLRAKPNEFTDDARRTDLTVNQTTDLITATDSATMKRTFQRFTTPALVPDILQSCLPGLSGTLYQITACTILDAKLKKHLKPASAIKSTLSVCYRLALRESSRRPSSEYLVYVKVFQGGRSVEAFHRLANEETTDLNSSQTIIHVPELDMIVWRFPHDPALPHLRQLIDLDAVGAHLPSNGMTQLGLSGTPQVLSNHVVNYRPEERCTIRYHLCDPNRGQTYTLFGKTFRTGEGQPLFERQEYFWNQSLANSDAMAVARPLGYSEHTHTVWQLGVLGTPLLQILDSSNYEHYSRAISRGLASLHTSDVAGLLTHRPADHIAEIQKKLAKLSDAIPLLSRRLHALGDELERIAPQPSAIPFCPIHWDFHIEQLLASQERVVFCDLDELIIGDPVQDLANFMVDLHFRNIDEQSKRLITAELYYAYRQQVEWNVPIERLAWHARLQFINKAYRHYLRFAPGFEDTVERILQLAERGFSL